MIYSLRIFNYIIFSCYILYSAHSYECNKPTILGQKEYIVEAGGNLTFICEGDESLTWSWPEVNDTEYSKFYKLEITDTTPANKTCKYGRRIYLQNVTYLHTGFFSCSYTNKTEMDQIYLYVKDESHLFVSQYGIEAVTVTQYSDAVLPCRPTSPDVSVQLNIITGEQVYLDTTGVDDTMYSFHPHYGFKTNDTQTPRQDMYFCTFSRDNKTEDMTIILDVETYTTSLAKPILKEITGGHTVVGEKLILECRVRTYVPVYVSFTWTTPNAPVNFGRIDISPQKKYFDQDIIIAQNLTINNSTLSDSGIYYCNVSDNQNHHNGESISVKIHAHSYECNKPTILGQKEYIVEAGGNLTFICEGDESLTWSWPEINDTEYSKFYKLEITYTIPANKTCKYGTRIYLQNVTYLHTGFFSCSYTNKTEMDQIYLYVKDESHLCASQDSVETVLVTQYSDAVLPCRPTSPDVSVELTLIGGEKVYLDTTGEDDTIYSFHPHYGFKTNDTQTQIQQIYLCTFSRDNETEVTTILLDIETYTTSLAKPILKEITGGHTMVGEKLILECRVRTITRVSFTWTTPNGPVNFDRIDISPQKKYFDQDIIAQNLTINNSTLSDSGIYYCNVSDNQNHHSGESISVKIHETNEHFIYLTEENQVSNLTANPGESDVKWHINVDAHSLVNLSWFNNKGNLIPEGHSSNYFTNFSSNETLLLLKKIDREDSGNYTLVAENNIGKENSTVSLNAVEKLSSKEIP